MFTDIGLVLIRFKIDSSSGRPKLAYDSQYVAFMDDDTSPVFSVDPPHGPGVDPASVDLGNISPRSFGFSIGLVGGTGSGYSWHPNPAQSLAIAVSGTPLNWGGMPLGFTPCKAPGGNLTFMDNSNAGPDGEGMAYEYKIRVFKNGDPTSDELSIDPRILNSRVGIG